MQPDFKIGEDFKPPVSHLSPSPVCLSIQEVQSINAWRSSSMTFKSHFIIHVLLFIAMVTRYILLMYSVLAIIQFHDPRDVKAQLEHSWVMGGTAAHSAVNLSL